VSLIAVTAAKGSPGVTTTALAYTMTWTSPVIMAECDPAGGSVLAGFLRGQLSADRGIVPLAVAELRNERLAVDFWRHLVDFDPPNQQRLLLPGISDPAQAGSLEPIWARLAAYFAALEARHNFDVLADCGRVAVPHPPSPILQAADLVLVVMRPNLASIAATSAAIRSLRVSQAEHGSVDSLGLVLVGSGAYSALEIAKQLQTPVVVELPHDARSATALSEGGAVRHSSHLLRRTADSEQRLRALIARRRMPRSLANQEVARGR
jgi:MinD-like ATPase involved in chromosome partitioning or flagellar assembly